jgi:diguanylate cyclase (GGDEF)-like protein/PAS domain S-box-containing protein
MRVTAVGIAESYMRIRSLLTVAVSLAMLVTVGLGAALWLVAEQLAQVSAEQARAQAVARDASALLVLTHEYALHAEERIRQQWRAHHAHLLDTLAAPSGDVRSTPQEAAAQANALSTRFDQLAATTGTSEDQVQQRRTLLLDQLLTHTQALFDTANRWGDTAGASRQAVERGLQWLLIAVPGGMLVILVALAALLARHVLDPLARLHAAVLAVARGDLSVRCASTAADEFGVLARTFDAMAVDLVSQLRREVAERQQAEQSLAEFSREFETFLDQTPEFVYFKDRDSRFRFCSQTLARITGHASWREMIGKHDLEVFPADTARIYFEEERPIFSEGRSLLDKVDPYYDADGRPGYVQTCKWPLFDDHGQVVGLIGTSRDITEQKRNEGRLQLAASVFTHAREGIIITDADARIVEVNDAFTRITGCSRAEALGQNPRILKSGRQAPEFYTAMWQALTEQGHWSGEVWNRRRNGEVYAELLTISAVRDAAGTTQNYVGLFTDITLIKDHQRELEHIVHYDALTRLPNRVLLADRLHQAMAQSQRRGQSLAVVYLDLDGFKAVNDQHGHEAGDELLICVARHMHDALRQGDTLARIGGDEFVAVLVDLADPCDCEPVLLRLLQAAARSVTAAETLLNVSASIGVTLYPQDEADADLLLRHADQAMYLAKQAGRNRYHLFDADQLAAVKSQRETH